LRAGPFNESLAEKPVDYMEEIMSRAECYIKGEESNAEKKVRDAKERGNTSTEKKKLLSTTNKRQRNFQTTRQKTLLPQKISFH